MTSDSTPQRASLPARPSLENLRNQAKSLYKSFHSGAPESAARILANHPEQIERAAFRLADAQLVVARELGFPSWPKLKAYVESIYGARSARMRPFRTDIEYYEARAEGLLSQFTSKLPGAADQIRKHHLSFANMADEQVFECPFTKRDALLVMAREHGFDTWLRFRNHIHELAQDGSIEPFMLAFQAIEKHDLQRLKQLLELDGTLANASGTNGNTLLNLAGSCRFIEGTQLLLTFGADPNQPNVRGSSPLHQAAYSNQHTVVQLLLEAGANPGAYALGDGGTPLIMALFWGHREAADILAAHSLAPFNLRAAAGTGSMDLLRSLFKANGCLRPEAGMHREFYRPHSGFPVWQPSTSEQEILDEAFVYAAKSCRMEALEFLLRHGAAINADPYRGTALTWVAAGSGDILTAKWLVEHGAEVNKKGTFGGPSHGEGITALHMAAQTGKLEFVKFLISCGADPAIRDDLYNGDAIGHASHFGHVEAVDYLKNLTTTTATHPLR